MKRGQTTIILTILVVSIFSLGITPTEAVTSYQSLATGDQLLYKNVFNFYEDLEQQLFHEVDVSPEADSWWVIDHWDYIYDEMESYSINSIDTSTGNVNYTWTIYDRNNNRTQAEFYYDYIDLEWELSSSSYDYEPVTQSGFVVENHDVYDGVLNLDVIDWFFWGVYSHSEVKYYVINGINSSHNVDVYIDTYSDNIKTLYSYYDITFQEDNPYGWEDVFYVDSSTGFLLEYTTMYYDNYYRSIDNKYSSNLGTNVNYYFNHTYTYEYSWQLYETTAAYTPVADADLPAMIIDLGYTYDIRGDSDTLSIYFDLYNSWPSMTVEVFLDGRKVDTIYDLTPGNNVYHLDTKSIPVSSNNHAVQFVVYDDASFEHNTTWALEIQDIRPDWPRITGPEGDFYYTLGTFDTLNWYLFDDYDNPDYYKLKLNGLLVSSGSWFDGMEVNLILETNITTVGDYFVTVYAIDFMGYETYKDLTIHASDVLDTTPPLITGPTSTITLKKGDSVQLVWNILDENPDYYVVKVNGTEIINTPWFIEDFNVTIELNTLDVGAWYYEIQVYDLSGNPSYASVFVVVTEDITNPTDPTDPTEPTTPGNSNTLILNAPGIITTILGFISFVALVTLIRKRK